MSSSDEIILSGTHNGQDWRLKRAHDEDPVSPREGENLWTLAFAHRRYTLGDVQVAPDDFQDHLRSVKADSDPEKDFYVLPVYMFDHSGLAFSINDFNDRFDSGQIGRAYVSVQSLIENYGGDTAETRARAQAALASELDEYQSFVNGEIYGYIYETRANPKVDFEQKEAIWNIVDDDLNTNGALDYFPAHVAEAFNAPKAPSRPRLRR